MKFDGIKKLTRLGLVLGLAFVSLFLMWLFLGSQHVVTATAPITGDPISTGSSTSLFLSTQPVTSVVNVDLNHDGHEDLAFGEGNNLRIVENNSSATSLSWSSTTVISATNEPISDLAAADFDQDGLADLVIATAGSSGTGRVFLLQNPATPFTATWSVSKTLIAPASLYLTTVATGDLNGDGAPDVVAAGSDGIIRLWENPASGNFNSSWGSAIQIATGAGKINQIALADLDRDGRLDIIAVSGGSTSQVMAWQNPGTPFGGIWSTTNTLGSLGADGLSLAVGDFNNDGAPDVAAGLGNGSVLAWGNPILSGQPFSTSWGSATIVENGIDPVEALQAVDMDNDGYAELVRASGGASPSLVVLYGRQTLFTGAWPSHSVGTSGSAFYSLAAGDFDLDGDIDIASGSGDSLLFWPNTLFHQNMAYADNVVGVMDTNGNSSSSIWATASADLDGDGYPDIVTGGYYSNTGYVLVAWENMGAPFQAGGWTKHTIATLDSAVYSIALGDLDKDGKVDIITGLDSGQLLVWKNDGTPFNGEWTAHSIGTPSERVESLATGDLDGDGYLDIVTGTGRDEYLSNDNYKVTAWHNSGNPFVGTWTNYDVDTVTFSVHSVAIGDLDNDGKPDIVAGVNHAPAVGTPQDPISSTLWIDNYEVRAYQNNGNPFGEAWTRTNVGRDPETASWKLYYHGYWGATVYGVALADLNNDGNMDIITTDHLEADYQVKVWKNDGTPFSGEEWQATAAGVYSPWMNASVYTVAVGDFNHDGLMDLVTGSGETYETVIWENTGRPFGTTITDTTWIRYNLGLGASNAAFSLAVSDLDRDGDLDIAQGSGSYYGPFSGNDLLVWHNRGGAVTERARLTSPTGMLAGAEDDLMSVDVSHNGKWDDHNAQLVWWRLTLADGNGTPLTSTQAANLFQNFSVYRDTGDGIWNAGDTYIGSVAVNDTTVGSNGVFTFTFPVASPNTPFAIHESATFFIVAQLQPSITAPTTFQAIFDPDAASLVEDTTTLSSLSIEDTDPVTAQVTVDTPITGLTAKNNSPNALSSPTMFTATVTGGTSIVYQWAFGDGIYDNGATVTHTYSVGGFYTAVVTATNSLGSFDATTTVTVTNPMPVLSSLSPDTGVAGDPGFILTVNGSGFVSGATVYWDGSARPTSVISSTQLTASISAADIALAGSYPVTVTNPGPGGGASNALNFAVDNPAALLSSLSPDTAIAGDPGFTLTVNGSGFVSGATVYWDGSARPTSVISSTQLTASIGAADIVLAGSYPVTVTNPEPGGGASNALNFEVIAVGKTIYLPVIYR